MSDHHDCTRCPTYGELNVGTIVLLEQPVAPHRNSTFRHCVEDVVGRRVCTWRIEDK